VKKRTLFKPEKLQFRILAPSVEPIPSSSFRTNVDPKLHSKLLFDLQLLRGNALREYCPFAAGLTADGRHFQSADAESWHVLLEDEDGRVRGCARYRPVNGGFNQLGARESSLAKSHTFGSAVRRAIENHIRRARAANMQYGEAGGWVLCPEIRCSTAAINIALMTFALADRLGGGMGITTATTRHQSASILRRLGGHRLGGLPAYYDPKYGCVLEILGFDMKSLRAQFARKLDELRGCLNGIQIVCKSGGEEQLRPAGELAFIAQAQRMGAVSAVMN
jgi:hypothetical protein